MKKVKRVRFFIVILYLLIFYFVYIFESSDISAVRKSPIYYVYDSENDLLARINKGQPSSYISINQIPSKLKSMIINIEDKDFYNHSGFDISRIIITAIRNFLNNKEYGASTITQQYVKNTYLTNEKKISRKINELFIAAKIETELSKDKILEEYLNSVYFGCNCYGIEDASNFYFGKKSNQITVNEMALLCAIIKAPSTYSPITNYSNSMKKKDEILIKLYKSNIISESEYFSSFNKNIIIKQVKNKDSIKNYYLDIVKEEINKMKLPKSKNNTYKIYTSYDKNIISNIKEYNSFNGNYSFIVANKYGEVLSLAGGSSYFDSPFNVAYHGERDIGSTIKPFLYYEALKCGMTPLTELPSKPLTFKIKNDIFTTSNFNSIYENRNITMGYALATSDNTYATQTHLMLGMGTLVNHLKKYKITSKPIPSLSLGSVSISLKKLIECYSCFQTLGYYNRLHTIKSIEYDNKKKEIKYPKTKILNSDVCFTVNEMMTWMFDTKLSRNMTVTGKSISNQISYKTSGKSGLTDYDSYMIGFNPEVIIGVWAGKNNNEYLSELNIKSLPKKIFSNIYNTLPIEKKDIWFDCPSNISYKYVDPTSFNNGYKKKIAMLN